MDYYGFDVVIGLNCDVNLKGKNKVVVLVECYGEGGFDYVGDYVLDCVIWDKVDGVIVVGDVGGVVKGLDVVKVIKVEIDYWMMDLIKVLCLY